VDVVEEEQRRLSHDDREDRLDDARRGAGIRPAARGLPCHEPPDDRRRRVARTVRALAERTKEWQVRHRDAALDRGASEDTEPERHREVRRFAQEPGLADSGLADHKREPWLLLRGRLERGREQLDLRLAAHKWVRVQRHDLNDTAQPQRRIGLLPDARESAPRHAPWSRR
jgi:hypothetical protein